VNASGLAAAPRDKRGRRGAARHVTTLLIGLPLWLSVRHPSPLPLCPRKRANGGRLGKGD